MYIKISLAKLARQAYTVLRYKIPHLNESRYIHTVNNLHRANIPIQEKLYAYGFNLKTIWPHPLLHYNITILLTLCYTLFNKNWTQKL